MYMHFLTDWISQCNIVALCSEDAVNSDFRQIFRPNEKEGHHANEEKHRQFREKYRQQKYPDHFAEVN